MHRREVHLGVPARGQMGGTVPREGGRGDSGEVLFRFVILSRQAAGGVGIGQGGGAWCATSSKGPASRRSPRWWRLRRCACRRTYHSGDAERNSSKFARSSLSTAAQTHGPGEPGSKRSTSLACETAARSLSTVTRAPASDFCKADREDRLRSALPSALPCRTRSLSRLALLSALPGRTRSLSMFFLEIFPFGLRRYF